VSSKTCLSVHPVSLLRRLTSFLQLFLAVFSQNGPDVKMNFRDADERPLPFSICLHSDLKDAHARVVAVRKMVDEMNEKYFN